MSFGNHVVGKISTALNVILTNSDPAIALSIGSIVASGEYTESDDCNGECRAFLQLHFADQFQAERDGSVDRHRYAG